jgi:hypothetical protein
VQDYAELIKAIATLLWPIFAFVALVVFRVQIGGLLIRLSNLKKGEFFGQKMEFSDTLEQDSSSKTLYAYLNPGGKYDDKRARKLNALLKELGVARDVRLILDGSETAPLRRLLIEYAKHKGTDITAGAAAAASE